MVAFGSPERSSASSSTIVTTPFTSKLKNIPPPLANSTPKKLKHVNGVINAPISPYKRAKLSNDDGSPRKGKTVYMDVDEEDHGVSLSVNGISKSTRVENQKRNAGHSKDSKPEKKFLELQEQRKQLPIAKGRATLIDEFKRNDTIVLLGETGSGKTTQVPQYILESGLADPGVIAVTQPRRVAATSLATRVAQEQGVKLGTCVGFAVRFSEMYGPETRIKYVTDGMLARELQMDPLLSRYSVIVVDEAHERTLNTDILLASLKGIQQERRKVAALKKQVGKNDKGKGKAEEELGPLKVVIMSATLDAEKFSKFFNNAKILYVKGRQHPVKTYYTTISQTDYVDSALRTFFQIHVDHPPGDVLIFLPGQEDIEGLEKAIQSYSAQLPVEYKRVVTCSLYAALPQSQQTKAFLPTPKDARKVILATNIAETSITIPGIRYVIDTGKCKEKRHIAGYSGGGMDTLLTQDICKSSAMQRTGRAGREGPGMCFRLYTEDDFQRLPDASTPEIMRCSLTSSVLQLKCLGLDLLSMDFMDKPDTDAIHSAYKSLYLLGAFDKDCEVSVIGREMNHFPLEPSFARALIASKENGCTLEVLGIISVLSSSAKLFFDPSGEESREQALEARSKFRHASGDHMTALSAFRAYQEIANIEGKAGRKEWCRRNYVNERALSEAVDIQVQLKGICERLKIDWQASCMGDTDKVLKSLLTGMPEHIATWRIELGGYKQALGGGLVKIHPGSVLAGRKVGAIVYDELVFTGSTYARGVSSVPVTLIHELPVFQVRKSLV